MQKGTSEGCKMNVYLLRVCLWSQVSSLMCSRSQSLNKWSLIYQICQTNPSLPLDCLVSWSRMIRLRDADYPLQEAGSSGIAMLDHPASWSGSSSFPNPDDPVSRCGWSASRNRIICIAMPDHPASWSWMIQHREAGSSGFAGTSTFHRLKCNYTILSRKIIG